MHLVYDGYNLAYRCNSVTDLYTKQGERVSAIFGTVKSIISDIETLEKKTDEVVEDITFAWDFGRSERRTSLYPEYKGNRGDKDEGFYTEFLNQVNCLHDQLLPKLGIRSVRFKGWEADDIIYAITQLIKDQDLVIISNDTDFFQLIRDNVTVYSPIKKEFYNNQNFRLKFGIPLEGYISYKALVGDPSDNIPGISGIGKTTGADLINKYLNVQGIIKARKTGLLKSSKRVDSILQNYSIIPRNMELIDLSYVDYSPIEEDLEKLLACDLVFNSKETMEFFRQKQFTSLLVEFNKISKVFKRIGNQGLG